MLVFVCSGVWWRVRVACFYMLPRIWALVRREHGPGTNGLHHDLSIANKAIFLKKMALCSCTQPAFPSVFCSPKAADRRQSSQLASAHSRKRVCRARGGSGRCRGTEAPHRADGGRRRTGWAEEAGAAWLRDTRTDRAAESWGARSRGHGSRRTVTSGWAEDGGRGIRTVAPGGAVAAKYLAATRHKRSWRALLRSAHGACIAVIPYGAESLARGARIGAVVGRNTLDHARRSSRALVAARTKLRDARPRRADESAWARDPSRRPVATVRTASARNRSQTSPRTGEATRTRGTSASRGPAAAA